MRGGVPNGTEQTYKQIDETALLAFIGLGG
jgi:hypothetical protein